MSQPQPYYPPPKKSHTTLIIAIVVIVVIVVAAVGTLAALGFYFFSTSSVSSLRLPHTTNIVNGLITVQPGKYQYYQFTAPSGATSINVGGTFTATGGTGNDIETYVMDNANFVNWQNDHQPTMLYNSGRVTVGTVTASLPGPGTYDLVYSNTFSTYSSKNVQTTVYLYYVN